MIERTPPKLVKWPFLLSDLLLLALAAWIAFRHEPSIGLWSMALCLIAVALGAWLCAMPFLREYAAMLAFAEADTLA